MIVLWVQIVVMIFYGFGYDWEITYDFLCFGYDFFMALDMFFLKDLDMFFYVFLWVWKWFWPKS